MKKLSKKLISTLESIPTNQELIEELDKHIVTITISDLFNAYQTGSVGGSLQHRGGMERYDFVQWLKRQK